MSDMTSQTQRQLEPAPEVALIIIPLAKNVSASELGGLLSGLGDYYTESEYVDSLASGTAWSDIGNGEFGRIQVSLEILYLQIGTPNVLKVKGVGKHVLSLAAILTAVLGVPVAGMEAFKSYEEARQTEVHTQVEELDLREKALRLFKNGTISADEYQRIAGVHARAIAQFRQAEGAGLISSNAHERPKFVPDAPEGDAGSNAKK